MGELAMPIFNSKVPSTTRAEELLWHCVIAPNWESDLSSQIFRANLFWDTKQPVEAANEIDIAGDADVAASWLAIGGN